MASFRAIHLVGASLVKHLDGAFAGALRDPFPRFHFRLVSSGELDVETVRFDRTVTLHLYRVTAEPGAEPRAPLGATLHYLVTVWSSVAAEEQLVLGWVMRELHDH